MSLSEAEAAVKRVVLGELSRSDLLLPAAAHERVVGQVYRHGDVLWQRLLETLDEPMLAATPAALGLDCQVMERVLGFGYLQTEALASRMAAASPATGAGGRAPWIGALFNLGIGLFDWIYDQHPEGAELIRSHVTQQALARLTTGDADALPPVQDQGVGLLYCVIRAFFAELGSLTLSGGLEQQLDAVLRRMLVAETTVSSWSRATNDPGWSTWWELRNKSVLPSVALALIASLGGPAPTAGRLRSVRGLGQLAGELLWIVDDLVDAAEDWRAGTWSRPWLLHAWWRGRITAEAATATEAIGMLVDSGIVHAEAGRLVQALARLRGQVGNGNDGDDLDQCFRATVQSWIGRLPG